MVAAETAGGGNGGGGGNNGGDNGDTDDTGDNGQQLPPPATPGPIDTHRVYPVDEQGELLEGKRVGWLVWIYYQDPPTEGEVRGLTFGTSGFTVKVYVDSNLVIDSKTEKGANTGIVQTQGTDDEDKPDYSIQFFVSTEDYEKKDPILLLR